MSSLTIRESTEGLERLIALVVDGKTSQHTKSAYRHALTHFVDWWTGRGKPAMCRAVVNAYKAHLLEETDLSPSAINQRLTAIRNLAKEAKHNQLMDSVVADGIMDIEGVTAGGRRTGNWLTLEQAQELMNTPNPNTILGRRDRALLAVAIGAGLRRTEITELTFAHIQKRDDRWMIVDLVGKRNKLRSIPIADWIKTAIDAWASVAHITDGRIFRPLTRGGALRGKCIVPQTVYDVVKKYAAKCGITLAPHDLRRTFAKLADKAKTPIPQIQLSLGHESLDTTARYLGTDQDLVNSPSDSLALGWD